MAESSYDRLRRLLTLVPWLAAHSGVSKAEAAAHFGLSPAQLESDLALVTVTGPGLYGGDLVDIYFDDATITVYDAQGLLEPVHLTRDESATLALGLQALQQLADEDAVIAAALLEKIGGGDAAELAVSVNPSPFGEQLGDAIRDGSDVKIAYAHPVRDDVTERVVTPWRVVARDGIQYLHGYCHQAEAARTFRLDRILQCSLQAPTHDPAADTAAETRMLEARVTLPAADEWLLERVPHTVVQGEPPLTALVQYADEEWLIRWLMECGAPVQCLEPAHVAAEVARRADSARNMYLRLH